MPCSTFEEGGHQKNPLSWSCSNWATFMAHNPCALCVAASDKVLLCADDDQAEIIL